MGQSLRKKYGEAGTPSRTEFEIKAQAFIIGEILKEKGLKISITDFKLTTK